MIIKINTLSQIPLYLQLRNQIVKGIGKGELTEGESLPTVRQMAADLGINTMTVSKSYQLLKNEGFLYTDLPSGKYRSYSGKRGTFFSFSGKTGGRTGTFKCGSQDPRNAPGRFSQSLQQSICGNGGGCGMMLFWILAITDLIMVGITWAVYGSSATYRDGMLLGVHLPESAASLPPVVQLTDSYKKRIRQFYLLHLFLGVAVAAPFFWRTSVAMILWCIWLCVFLIRAVSLLYSAHRQLYLLKQDLKLCNRAEESFTAAVDTHTATQTGKAKLPLYWHLLPLVMVFIPLFFSSVRNYIHADTTGLLFLVTWIAVWLLFLLIAWCYSKTGNRIYSAHTEINLAINMQEHRSWSWMFFFYSLCNSLAFISELIFLVNDLEWYWWSHLLFFIFQTIPIVTIFVIYFRVKKKKAQILAATMHQYTWMTIITGRNGWYNNPVDPGL